MQYLVFIPVALFGAALAYMYFESDVEQAASGPKPISRKYMWTAVGILMVVGLAILFVYNEFFE